MKYVAAFAFALSVTVVLAVIAPDRASYFQSWTDWRTGYVEVHASNWPVEIRQWVE